MLVFGFLDIYSSTANENVLTLAALSPSTRVPLVLISRERAENKGRHGQVRRQGCRASRSRHLRLTARARRGRCGFRNLSSCLLPFVYFSSVLLGSLFETEIPLLLSPKTQKSLLFFFFDGTAGRRGFNFKKCSLTGVPEDPDNVFCKEFFKLSSFSSSPDGKLPSKVKKKESLNFLSFISA